MAAGLGRPSADSVMIPLVSKRVPSVAGDFPMRILLLLIFLFCHTFLSFSAFMGAFHVFIVKCYVICK